jgi:ATP-binding cassette subfamily B protein
VFDRSVTLPIRFHDRHHSGELVSRLTTDVGRVQDAVTAATLVVLADGLLVAGTLAVLSVVAPDLALVALLVVPPLAAVAVVQRRRVRSAETQARGAAGGLAALATDLLGAVRIVQVFNRRGSVQARFRAVDSAVLDARLDAVRVQAGWAPRADLVLAAGTAATLVVGVLEARAGSISTGTLLLALAYVRDLYGPIRSLAKLAGTFAKAGASAARIGRVLDAPEHVAGDPSAPAAPPVTLGVGFHGVRFGHDPAGRCSTTSTCTSPPER